MEAFEKRHPRARFTKQLSRICHALDAASAHDIAYRLYGEEYVSHVAASELWVVGSYARGALLCADLDIVVNFTSTGAAMPLPSVVYKAFFGRCADVRFYSGTPEENMSGVTFPDAVLVWSSSDASWQPRIEAILIDPSAGRAARDTDSIPLRSEQLDTDSHTLSLAAQWEREGILTWDFFPLDDELMAPIPEAYVGYSGNVLMRLATHLGQKSRALIPALWRIMNHIEPGQAWQPLGLSKTLFRCGTAHIHIGRPRLFLNYFDDPKIGTLVLAPHRTGRGPNGVWVIYRGPSHPLAADESLLPRDIDRCR